MSKRHPVTFNFTVDLRPEVRRAGCVHGTMPRVKGFVVHTAECFNRPGVGDLTGMAHYLEGTPDRLMPQYGIDGEANSARFGNFHDLMYHAAGANTYYHGCELIGFTATTKHQWLTTYNRQLLKLSRLIAWDAERCGYRINRRTVLGHYNFPAGGHHDPGETTFPLERVRKDARYYRRHGKHLAYAKGGLLAPPT